MKLSKKTIAALLTGSALTVLAPQASAISVNNLGTLAVDPLTLAGNSAVKNWADSGVGLYGLGWMHTSNWYTFTVSSAGTVDIKVTDTSAGYSTVATSAAAGTTTTTTYDGNTSHPAFTLFSVGAGGFNGANATNSYNVTPPVSTQATAYPGPATTGLMAYDQVDLSAQKSGAFLLNGGATGVVGYANSGATFINAMGDAVGNGSLGSSFGTSGGHNYAELNLSDLVAGVYLLVVGNNCFTLSNCGNEASQTVVTNTATGAVQSTVLNPANTWGTAHFTLAISSVPLPASVWMFAATLAGFAGLRRRRA